jgi:hypothetical protein
METVTPLRVAFPELQSPTPGLPITDDEAICRSPVEWIPPFMMAQPVIVMFLPPITVPPMFNC